MKTASLRIPESPREVAAALEGLEVAPLKARGQSFLTDPFVADAEAALVGTAAGEPVVEVGGGLGILTAALLRRGLGPLTVIEREPRLVAFLRYHFGERLRVVEGDALTIPIPEASAVVGNLPFSVATPILLRLFATKVPRVIALVQREVGERLSGAPGTKAYGRLTILTAVYGTVLRFQTVPSKAFYPVPKVDGLLITFRRHPERLAPSGVARLEAILDGLFASRRKQLGNLLPATLARSDPGTDPDALAGAAGWPGEWRRLRPEELSPEAYFNLVRSLSESTASTSADFLLRRQV